MESHPFIETQEIKFKFLLKKKFEFCVHGSRVLSFMIQDDFYGNLIISSYTLICISHPKQHSLKISLIHTNLARFDTSI